ncbi:type II toxin-antitoxin system HigB family toxin [candidate division KSB1 bacterium]|nr:type II toxin-antitoxin system HigB family toxin [candidate division KSB1 bacterium]
MSRKTLREFTRQHSDSKTALDSWFHILEKNRFDSFNELLRVFPSADKVGDLFVFNIGGNKYRLITSIHFNRQKVYVRYVLTHEEYEREKWKP